MSSYYYCQVLFSISTFNDLDPKRRGNHYMQNTVSESGKCYDKNKEGKGAGVWF